MNTPLCPNCREYMSSVEQGLGGVWSCLYCEGVWLSQDRMKALCTEPRAHPLSPRLPGTLRDEQNNQQLLCPSCGSRAFHVSEAGQSVIHCCSGCSGLFIERGSLQAVAPEAIAIGQEAPILTALAGIVASVFTLDPGLVIAALQSPRPTKNAP